MSARLSHRLRYVVSAIVHIQIACFYIAGSCGAGEYLANTPFDNITIIGTCRATARGIDKYLTMQRRAYRSIISRSVFARE